MFQELLSAARELPQVSQSAIDEYAHNRAVLVARVNARMEAHPAVASLTDGSILVMRDNHANHALFMETVFRMNSPETLARTVPWVYRAYRNHGFSYEYFPTELRAWIEAIGTHLSAESAHQILPAYRWMIAQHETMIRLAESPPETVLPQAHAWTEQASAMLAALLEGQRGRCVELAQQLVQRETDLPGFYLTVLQPCMYRVGSLWESGEISVAQEHLATSLVSRIMASIYQRLVPPESTLGTAVVTAAPQEYHELGARMVADMLELDGWDVLFLGANTPVEDIIRTVVDRKAQLVALSASMFFNVTAVRELFTRLRTEAGVPGLRLMAGGQAFALLPDCSRAIGADACVLDAEEGVALARRWRTGALPQ